MEAIFKQSELKCRNIVFINIIEKILTEKNVEERSDKGYTVYSDVL